QVILTALDTAGKPLPDVGGKLFITHQKVRADACSFDLVFSATHSFTTGLDGTAAYTGPVWLHDNSQDLWRVQVESAYFPIVVPQSQVQVKYYSQSNFQFTTQQLPPL
ncbi:MAG: hypothetical protein ABIQ11_08460, partial [Saprospiraceae bacterium]